MVNLVHGVKMQFVCRGHGVQAGKRVIEERPRWDAKVFTPLGDEQERGRVVLILKIENDYVRHFDVRSDL